MMTVHEVSRLAGVSIRTLQYYDRIGLLPPSGYSEAGYRLYGKTDLERLQHILLFRELEFPLKDIRSILDSPDFHKDRALEQQIELLKLKKEHLEHLLAFAQSLKEKGAGTMDFKAFDKSKLDEYAKRAKEQYGNTPEYREYEKKSAKRTKEEEKLLTERFMQLFQEAGTIRQKDPASPEAQAVVKRIQDFISENMYPCSDQILKGLGSLYGAGGEFTQNIDAYGGEGTGAFVEKAIRIYCAGRA